MRPPSSSRRRSVAPKRSTSERPIRLSYMKLPKRTERSFVRRPSVSVQMFSRMGSSTPTTAKPANAATPSQTCWMPMPTATATDTISATSTGEMVWA